MLGLFGGLPFHCGSATAEKQTNATGQPIYIAHIASRGILSAISRRREGTPDRFGNRG